MTNLPYRSWCKICLRAKAKAYHHMQQYDRKPLLQAGYGLLIGNEAEQEILVLSCIGITNSCAVPQKGVGDYPIATHRKFVMECGKF